MHISHATSTEENHSLHEINSQAMIIEISAVPLLHFHLHSNSERF